MQSRRLQVFISFMEDEKMKQIKELIQSLDYELLQGSLEGEISELVYDTR